VGEARPPKEANDCVCRTKLAAAARCGERGSRSLSTLAAGAADKANTGGVRMRGAYYYHHLIWRCELINNSYYLQPDRSAGGQLRTISAWPSR